MGFVFGVEVISQRTYMHVCIAHGHRQQCGEGRGGGGEGWAVGGMGAGWRGSERGTWGTSIIVSTIKIKKK